jgi:hypothetical protein
MELFLQQLVAGIATGSIYACMALAVVMIYQAIRHLNFAQGELAMVSTFIAWQLMQWGLPYWAAFMLTIALSFAGGFLIQRIAFELTETDLRSLQILKNGDMPVQALGSLTHQPHRLRVVIEAAVGKIEPDHVRTFPQQALDNLGTAGIGSQGRYDLGEFHRFCHACSRSWPNSLKNQTNQTVIFIFSSASVTVHTADDHFPVARRQSAPAGLK